MPGGRPTKYSEEITKEICRRIMDGESLRSICEDDTMPNRSTIHLWLSEYKEFSDQYARAKEWSADTYADEIVHIADTAEDVNKARLQVDTRKWVASKLKAKKYGKQLDLTSDHKPLPTPIIPLDALSADDSNQEDN